jgi:hypothetical protein
VMAIYSTSETGDKIRVAVARVVSPRGYGRSPGLVVDQCPYCLHTHHHSIGEWSGGGVYGIREADCFNGEYLLVDEAHLEAHPERYTNS